MSCPHRLHVGLRQEMRREPMRSAAARASVKQSNAAPFWSMLRRIPTLAPPVTGFAEGFSCLADPHTVQVDEAPQVVKRQRRLPAQLMALRQRQGSLSTADRILQPVRKETGARKTPQDSRLSDRRIAPGRCEVRPRPRPLRPRAGHLRGRRRGRPGAAQHRQPRAGQQQRHLRHRRGRAEPTDCARVIGDTAFVVTLGGEIWQIDGISGPPYGR